jgi:hypothetical protein
LLSFFRPQGQKPTTERRGYRSAEGKHAYSLKRWFRYKVLAQWVKNTSARVATYYLWRRIDPIY